MSATTTTNTTSTSIGTTLTVSNLRNVRNTTHLFQTIQQFRTCHELQHIIFLRYLIWISVPARRLFLKCVYNNRAQFLHTFSHIVHSVALHGRWNQIYFTAPYNVMIVPQYNRPYIAHTKSYCLCGVFPFVVSLIVLLYHSRYKLQSTDICY